MQFSFYDVMTIATLNLWTGFVARADKNTHGQCSLFCVSNHHMKWQTCEMLGLICESEEIKVKKHVQYYMKTIGSLFYRSKQRIFTKSDIEMAKTADWLKGLGTVLPKAGCINLYRGAAILLFFCSTQWYRTEAGRNLKDSLVPFHRVRMVSVTVTVVCRVPYQRDGCVPPSQCRTQSKRGVVGSWR